MNTRDQPAADAATTPGTPVWLDPATVSTPSHLRFRAPLALVDAGFERLKQSIAHRGGNVQPIKVRPVGPGCCELVFGIRRLQACLELGLPVAAVVQEMSSQQQLQELDASNGDDQVSVYERGCLYEAALNAGYFPSRRRLAESLGRKLSDVVGAATVAQLPREILDALHDPRDLKVAVARRLATAAAADPATLTSRLRSAKLGPGARVMEVLKALAGSAHAS